MTAIDRADPFGHRAAVDADRDALASAMFSRRSDEYRQALQSRSPGTLLSILFLHQDNSRALVDAWVQEQPLVNFDDVYDREACAAALRTQPLVINASIASGYVDPSTPAVDPWTGIAIPPIVDLPARAAVANEVVRRLDEVLRSAKSNVRDQAPDGKASGAAGSPGAAGASSHTAAPAQAGG